MLLREILIKEEEKHRLKYIGLVSNWEDTVGTAESMFSQGDGSFGDIKGRFLELFYKSILEYGRFIENEKGSNYNLKRHHFRKTAAYVLNMRRAGEATLDSDLRTGRSLTVAFHFSNSVYDDMYECFCSSDMTFDSPVETDKFFFDESGKLYPADIDYFIERLSADDASFWEVCARYMQTLSKTVVNCFLQKTDSVGHSDLIRDNTWTDAYEVLRDRIVMKNGNIPVFGNGKDFRNYVIKVCRFLTGNIYRKYVLREDFLDDISAPKREDFDEEEYEDMIAFHDIEDENEGAEPAVGHDFQDINTDNPYEVAHAVSIILLNSQHPLHHYLIEGIEDKVGILVDKTTNGMSYNEIVEDMYGERNMSGEEFKRAVVKARKDYERVKKILCDRLINMIEKKVQ